MAEVCEAALVGLARFRFKDISALFSLVLFVVRCGVSLNFLQLNSLLKREDISTRQPCMSRRIRGEAKK